MAELLSPPTLSPNFLKPVPTADLAISPMARLGETATDDDRRSRAKEAADKFEGQFLSMMMQQMFQGVSTDGPFGGGFGEEMFRSLMTDAMATTMTKAGGIGLSDTIQREILKMQGLS